MLRRCLQIVRRAALAVALAGAGAAAAAPGEFARVDTDAEGRPRALQMAIASYAPVGRSAGGRRIDLVSAVHVADPSFYAALNERFRDYDALLYELVAPEGMVITPETRNTGFVSGAQVFLTRALGLSFQLDEVDYTPANFVHADLSQDELSASMAERNESLYTYFWRIVFATIREYARDPLGLRDWQAVISMVGSDGDVSFKTLLAYEIANARSIEEVFGEDADSAIIGARNARAVEVLAETLEGGAGSVGIFYGVGHMPDLEERLLAMGLERVGTTWIDAWQLGTTPAARDKAPR